MGQDQQKATAFSSAIHRQRKEWDAKEKEMVAYPTLKPRLGAPFLEKLLRCRKAAQSERSCSQSCFPQLRCELPATFLTSKLNFSAAGRKERNRGGLHPSSLSGQEAKLNFFDRPQCLCWRFAIRRVFALKDIGGRFRPSIAMRDDCGFGSQSQGLSETLARVDISLLPSLRGNRLHAHDRERLPELA